MLPCNVVQPQRVCNDIGLFFLRSKSSLPPWTNAVARPLCPRLLKSQSHWPKTNIEIQILRWLDVVFVDWALFSATSMFCQILSSLIMIRKSPFLERKCLQRCCHLQVGYATIYHVCVKDVYVFVHTVPQVWHNCQKNNTLTDFRRTASFLRCLARGGQCQSVEHTHTQNATSHRSLWTSCSLFYLSRSRPGGRYTECDCEWYEWHSLVLV